MVALRSRGSDKSVPWLTSLFLSRPLTSPLPVGYASSATVRIDKIEDNKEREEAVEARAAAVDDRGRSRADKAAVDLADVQEKLDLYVAVHGGAEPSVAVTRKWVKSVGGIKKARKLVK